MFECQRFLEALRGAIEDVEMSTRARSALIAVSSHVESVGPRERRLWAMLPALRAGRTDESTVIDLAVEIVRIS